MALRETDGRLDYGWAKAFRVHDGDEVWPLSQDVYLWFPHYFFFAHTAISSQYQVLTESYITKSCRS